VQKTEADWPTSRTSATNRSTNQDRAGRPRPVARHAHRPNVLGALGRGTTRATGTPVEAFDEASQGGSSLAGSLTTAGPCSVTLLVASPPRAHRGPPRPRPRPCAASPTRGDRWPSARTPRRPPGAHAGARREVVAASSTHRLRFAERQRYNAHPSSRRARGDRRLMCCLSWSTAPRRRRGGDKKGREEGKVRRAAEGRAGATARKKKPRRRRPAAS